MSEEIKEPVQVHNMDKKDGLPMMHSMIRVTDAVPGRENVPAVPARYFVSMTHEDGKLLVNDHIKWKMSIYTVLDIIAIRTSQGVWEGDAPVHYSLFVEMTKEYIKPKDEDKKQAAEQPATPAAQ